MIKTTYTDAYLIPHWVFWVSVVLLILVVGVIIIMIRDK